jgi:signal peptidase I
MSNQLSVIESTPLAPERFLESHGSPVAEFGGDAPSARPIPVVKHVLQFVVLSVLALGSYLFISHFVLQSVKVVGESMIPTLHDADYYFLNRVVCYFHAPKREDIVVIKDPSDGVYVVKRIVAMPGESVYFKNGAVYVNGKKISEPYLLPGTATFTNAKSNEELVLCGKDQYFVLGDNRNNSYDSRIYGPVRRQNILGVVIR